MLDRNQFPIAVPVRDGELSSLSDIKDWLRNNVGAIDHDWDYALNFNSSTAPSHYSVYFKSRSPALLFKLTWCGFA